MIAINKLLVMVFLVAFLCIDISPGLAQSNWQQQQWQRQQEMLRQQQLQQQRMIEQQRQQQRIQQRQMQQRQIQQQQQQMMRQQQIHQQQQGSAGLRQNSANRGLPAKNQIQQIPNRPRIVIKTPQNTTKSLKSSTSLSSRAQWAKQKAKDLVYKQKMKDRLFLIKKNKEERRLANLRKAQKEKNKKDTVILNRSFNIKSYGDWQYAAPNNGFLNKPNETTISAGTVIDRYGDGDGKFASPYKTPLEKRATPTGTERLPYSVYKVVKPIPALVGKVAPAFGKKGMGTQYQFEKSLDELEKYGYIKKIN